MNGSKKRVILTGASGFVGGGFVRYLSGDYNVEVLLNSKEQKWRLGDEPNISQIEQADFLIHSAWDMETESLLEIKKINVRGSILLIKTAFALKKPVIFISSMSAQKGTSSKYGRAKLIVEKVVQRGGGRIIRPGLIWDSQKVGGVFGKIEKLVNKMPILVLPKLPKKNIYLTNLEVLSNLVIEMLKSNFSINQKPEFADSKPYSLFDLVQLVAQRNQKRCFVVQIPKWIFVVILGIWNRLPMPVKIKLDSLTALGHDDVKPQSYLPIEKGN